MLSDARYYDVYNYLWRSIKDTLACHVLSGNPRRAATDKKGYYEFNNVPLPNKIRLFPDYIREKPHGKKNYVCHRQREYPTTTC
jgi:hypothetical protein